MILYRLAGSNHVARRLTRFCLHTGLPYERLLTDSSTPHRSLCQVWMFNTYAAVRYHTDVYLWLAVTAQLTPCPNTLFVTGRYYRAFLRPAYPGLPPTGRAPCYRFSLDVCRVGLLLPPVTHGFCCGHAYARSGLPSRTAPAFRHNAVPCRVNCWVRLPVLTTHGYHYHYQRLHGCAYLPMPRATVHFTKPLLVRTASASG